MAVTPRTNINGAHQQGVFVKTGSKLSNPSSSKALFLVAIAIPLAFDWIPPTSSLGAFKERVLRSFTALTYLPSGVQLVALLGLTICAYYIATAGRPYVQFAYNCFIKPFLKKKSTGIDSDEHRVRLEEFYQGQAEVYDVTRARYTNI
jgi:hypothetical protein